MKKQEKLFHFNIRYKLFGVFSILIIPFLIFGIILFSTGQEELNEKVTRTYVQTTNQLSITFMEYISRTDQTNRIVDNNASIPNWLRNEVTQFETSLEGISLLEASALSSLEEYAKTNEDVYSLTAVTLSGESITYVERKFDRSLSDYSSEYYEPLRESTGNTVLLPVKKSENYFSQQIPVFSVGFKHLDVTTDDVVGLSGYTGYIISECPTSILKGFCDNIDLGEGSSLYILDNCGTLAYTNEENDSIKNTAMTLLNASNSGEKLTVNNKIYYLVRSEIEDTKWAVYALIPFELISENSSRLQITFVLLSIITVIIIFFLAWIESRYFTKPIFALKDSMKLVANGDLTVRFEDKRKDEFGELGDGFNTLVDRIENLIADISESESREASAKYRMLQSQINPHFLYNTLDTIRMIAILEDKPDIADALLHLSKLFRYTVKDHNKLVTVKEEVEQIKNYLHLQNLRFGDKITVCYEIDEAVLGLRMPKMLLQPLLENVFNHAFSDLEENGLITVKITKDEENLSFSVTDNGIGIDKEKLAELKAILSGGKNDPSDSIGLANVNERLRLYYSDCHTLNIESEANKGTTISFTVPVNEQGTNLYNYEIQNNRKE